MRRIVLCVFTLILFLGQSWAADQKKRVAVLDFDFSAVQPWWSGTWDVGAGLADLIVSRLVTDGTYSVIERSALDAVLAEQNFSNSNRANPNSAAQIGQVLGVDAIIVGSITQFGTEDKSLSVGGIAGRWGGFGRGRVGKSEGKAKVAVEARIIDVNTAEILGVASGTGESSRSGLLLGGFGAGGGGFGGGSIDMGSSDFRDTILGEATHAAADDLSEELIDNDARIPVLERKVKGLIAYVDGSSLILNVGSNHGVAEGMELRVERVKDVVKDPATGEVLRELTEAVGTCRVTSVDDGSSEAVVVSGSGFAVGDVVAN